MILIDEQVETKLAEALENLRADPKTARCILFNLAGSAVPDEFKHQLTQLAQQHLSAIDAQFYLCGDGDLFILAPSIHTKDGRDFILAVSE